MSGAGFDLEAIRQRVDGRTRSFEIIEARGLPFSRSFTGSAVEDSTLLLAEVERLRKGVRDLIHAHEWALEAIGQEQKQVRQKAVADMLRVLHEGR